MYPEMSEMDQMDVDYQSEDGEIKIQKSPLDKEKQTEDILSFSLSEDDADDTADSLDIKPPQATVIHSYKSRSHREKRSHRDKDRRAFGHSVHISRGDSLSSASSHKKSHHHSREHRERREERHREREKRHHRDKHAVSSDSKRDRVDYGADDRIRDNSRSIHREDGVYRSREEGHGNKSVVVERVSYSETRLRDGRDARESREIREIRETREIREFRDHRESREPREAREQRESKSREEGRSESRNQEKVIEDLREQLVDKRRSDQDRTRDRDRDRRSRKRDRREAERFLQQTQDEQQQPQQSQQAPSQPALQTEKEQEKQALPAPKEPPLKKADKVERDMRRERLLEASREMDRQKEVYRRELEARRARRHLEEEKERTLESIAKKRERSRSRERKRRRGEGDENMDEDDVEKGDSDGSVKEVKVKSPKAGDHSSEENGSDSSSEGSTEEGEESDTDSGGGRTAERASDDEPLRRNGANDLGDDDEDDKDRDEVRSPSDSDTHSERSRPEENGKVASPAATPPPSPPPPSPPPPVDPFEGLPPYLPAIQGCRSVEEFQCLNRIEEGTYGVVYRARDKRTDEIVALKRLKMEKEKEGFPITSLREINTLLKAQHKNIVTVREIVVGSNMDKIFIVMDYVEHDLKSLMETMRHKKQAFSAGEVKCLMQQLLRAVNHLHDNWILHRDLKTSNLLLSHKGVLKVGDFGLAREYGSPLKAYTPIVVTLWYRSPELLLCAKEYSTPVDMWSVGCIYAEFLLMEALFPGKSEIDQLNRIFKELGTPNDRQWPGFSKLPAVQKMNFAEYPINQIRTRFGAVASEVGTDLLNKFLTYDPSKRITAEDAQQHPYFKESPVAIDPAMFPTWPAKSELGHRKAAASPKPPSGGKEYKQLGEGDEDVAIGDRFHMGGLSLGVERSRVNVGAGFSLKF